MSTPNSQLHYSENTYPIITLAAEDRACFVDAILNPPEPNKNLIKASERYIAEVEL